MGFAEFVYQCDVKAVEVDYRSRGQRRLCRRENPQPPSTGFRVPFASAEGPWTPCAEIKLLAPSPPHLQNRVCCHKLKPITAVEGASSFVSEDGGSGRNLDLFPAIFGLRPWRVVPPS